MLLLRPMERRALIFAKQHPLNYAEYSRVNALLGLARGETPRAIARKLRISEDRINQWLRYYESRRVRMNRRLLLNKQNFNNQLDLKARAAMPSLQILLEMARKPPTAIGADLDDDPADLC